MKTIRWGIIGCGAVTEVKSGPAFQQAAGSALVAVMRRDADKAADYARRHQVPRWYTDAGQLLSDPEVDAVYVATPPWSHAQLAVQALQAGKPVYVEKPMGRSHEECQAMLAAARQQRLPLFVAYYRRRLPQFLQVESLLRRGAIGRVRLVSAELWQPPPAVPDGSVPWRLQPEQGGGGLLFDLGSHQLDLLDYLLGPIESVCGQAANQDRRYRAEEMACAHLRFASGVMGVSSWCFAAAPGQWRDRVEIVGAEGRISFSVFGPDPVRLEVAGASPEEFAYPRLDTVQLPLVQTVVDQLLGHGQCPSTGDSAARTNLVLDQIVRDYYRR